MAVLLAGRVAERIYLGENYLGSSSDLHRAREKVRDLLTRHGAYGYEYLTDGRTVIGPGMEIASDHAGIGRTGGGYSLAHARQNGEACVRTDEKICIEQGRDFKARKPERHGQKDKEKGGIEPPLQEKKYEKLCYLLEGTDCKKRRVQLRQLLPG